MIETMRSISVGIRLARTCTVTVVHSFCGWLRSHLESPGCLQSAYRVGSPPGQSLWGWWAFASLVCFRRASPLLSRDSFGWSLDISFIFIQAVPNKSLDASATYSDA